MKNMKESLFGAVDFIKLRLKETLNDESGFTTMEILLWTVIIVGIMVLIFKPQVTTLFTNILSGWSTDITTMFNNAQ